MSTKCEKTGYSFQNILKIVKNVFSISLNIEYNCTTVFSIMLMLIKAVMEDTFSKGLFLKSFLRRSLFSKIIFVEDNFC